LIIIGLCGRSGSGKSTVAEFWRRMGAVVIDADEVCHYVYSENSSCVSELCERFGSDVAVDGVIVRPILAKRAYGAEGGIAILNSIAHKYIMEEIEKRICDAKQNGTRVVIIDAPLLFESGLDKHCDIVTAVVSSDALQVERLKIRDDKSLEELNKRLSQQLNNEELEKRCQCIIANNGSIAELRQKALRAMFGIQLKLGCTNRNKKRRFYVKKKC